MKEKEIYNKNLKDVGFFFENQMREMQLSIRQGLESGNAKPLRYASELRTTLWRAKEALTFMDNPVGGLCRETHSHGVAICPEVIWDVPKMNTHTCSNYKGSVHYNTLHFQH